MVLERKFASSVEYYDKYSIICLSVVTVNFVPLKKLRGFIFLKY